VNFTGEQLEGDSPQGVNTVIRFRNVSRLQENGLFAGHLSDGIEDFRFQISDWSLARELLDYASVN
jgi:hypothetical protein